MHRIDTPSAVESAPAPAAVGTPGFFTNGNPGGAVPATVLTADWFNAVQEEIVGAIEAAGIAIDKEMNDQLTVAIQRLANGPIDYVDEAVALTAADRARTIGGTAALTVTLPSAAAVGNGWWVRVLNQTATATMTLDPPGAETVNGLDTMSLRARHGGLVISDGDNWLLVRDRAPPILVNAFAQSGSIPNGVWSTPWLQDPGANALGLVWSAGAPTRLTVPADLAAVDLWMRGAFSGSGSGYRIVDIYRSGSPLGTGQTSLPIGVSQTHSPTYARLSVAVEDGDYLEMAQFQNSGGSLSYDSNAAIQVRGVRWR